MKYSIVIPTYNHCNDLLKPCIESIIKYSNIWDIELIVSANGCKDDTLAYLGSLKEKYNYLGLQDNLKVIWSNEALGYAKATNAGITVATTDYIVLLNNDTVLLQQPKNLWLELLKAQFDKNHDAGISCVMKSFSEAANAEFAVFFCVMIHKKVFDKIGLISLDYGIGGSEDIDFSIQTVNAGFRIYEAVEKIWSNDNSTYTGNFPLYHKGEGTVHDTTLVSNWNDIFSENSLTLAKKYNIDWYNKHVNSSLDTRFKRDLAWIKDTHDEIYREVIQDNCYQLTEKAMSNRNVIDIGANVGAFSILAAYLGAKKVIAIEPVLETYKNLFDNINKSKLSTIVPMKYLVSAQNGDKHKISINENSGHNSMYNVDSNYEIVETVTLHTLLESLDGDDILLKLDCEGAEYDILLSASHEDMQRINQVIIEIHADLHPEYKGFDIITNQLTSFGFKQADSKQIYGWNIDNNGNVYNMHTLPFRIEIWDRL